MADYPPGSLVLSGPQPALPGETPAAAYRGGAVAPPEDPIEGVRSFVNRLQVPMAEADQAVEMAMRFQGMRGYQRDLQSGMSSTNAMMKWAPFMMPNPRQASMSGAAALMRSAAVPKIVAPTATTPGYVSQPGQAVRFFPQPRAEWVEETRTIDGRAVPGQRNRVSGEWKPTHVPVARPEPMSIGERTLATAEAKKQADYLTGLEANLPSPTRTQWFSGGKTVPNPAYSKKTNEIAQLRTKIAGIGRTGTAAATAPATAAATKPGMRWRDASNRVWRYVGASTEPRTDKDPTHWVLEE